MNSPEELKAWLESHVVVESAEIVIEYVNKDTELNCTIIVEGNPKQRQFSMRGNFVENPQFLINKAYDYYRFRDLFILNSEKIG